MITLHPFGNYAHRQPLAYAQIRSACLGHIRLTGRLEEADVIAISHPKDMATCGEELATRMGPDQRLVLLSEEPFWDTVWGGDPLTRDQKIETDKGEFPLTLLTHTTSTLYQFDHIPYFPLTDSHFTTRYARWFARNAAMTPARWRAQFSAAPLEAAFFVTRRPADIHNVTLNKDVYALSNQRTFMAEACDGPRILRQGYGWGHEAKRQELADWHLDKFLQLHGQTRFLLAAENTHQRDYITEKMFDAFAVGAIPIYVAGDGHRAAEVFGTGAWLNMAGQPPEALPDLMADFARDAAMLDAYARTQSSLAALFADRTILQSELARLRAALVREFEAVLAG